MVKKPSYTKASAGKLPTKKELESELVKLRDIAARAQADLQNLKARAEREAMEMKKFATASVLLKLLPTLDNFQRAISHVPAELKEHEWVKGVKATEQELLRQLQDEGLKRMESLGTPVDPAKHEALMTGQGEEGMVIEIVEEGYMLHDRVLRSAKVKVGCG